MFKDIKEFSTGAPAQGIFLERFKEISRRTDEIVCTFVSKALSAMHESALQARDIFLKENPGVKIEIIDSQTAAGAQAFIAIEMARAADKGKNLAEVVKTGQDMLPRVKFLCAMETIKYFIRSGRAPKTAYMGEIFQVKPIIGMTNNSGLVENLGRVRGKSAALKKLPEMVKEYVDTTKPLHVITHYTDNVDDGNKLKELVASKYKLAEIYMTPYSPVMSGYTGPVFTIACYS
jgi:DegV family protein with EDD domain